MRTKEMITKQRTLNCSKENSPFQYLKNLWRLVWRMFMLMLGWKYWWMENYCRNLYSTIVQQKQYTFSFSLSVQKKPPSKNCHMLKYKRPRSKALTQSTSKALSWKREGWNWIIFKSPQILSSTNQRREFPQPIKAPSSTLAHPWRLSATLVI